MISSDTYMSPEGFMAQTDRSGGPAFPFMCPNEGQPVIFTGMSRFDYFAAAALTGLLAGTRTFATTEACLKTALRLAQDMVGATK